MKYLILFLLISCGSRESDPGMQPDGTVTCNYYQPSGSQFCKVTTPTGVFCYYQQRRIAINVPCAQYGHKVGREI